MSVGTRIKEERTRLGLSQDAFARVGRVQRRAQVRYEKDERQPDANYLAAIAAAGVDTDYVLTGRLGDVSVARAVENMGTRLKEIRGKRSVEEFAQLMGVTPEDITGIEERTLPLPPGFLKKLVETHPGRSIAWLWGGPAPVLDSPLTDQEIIMVMNYRAASEEGQELLRRISAFYASRSAQREGVTRNDL